MSDLYKDPRWQKKRLQVLERDAWKCCACKDATSTLHVHHIVYDGELWEAPDRLLQTLCEACHKKLGAHPKAGVYWAAVGFDGQRLSSPHVIVHWCPQCGETEFTTANHGQPLCKRCRWNASIYDRVLFGPEITISSAAKPKKPHVYSVGWLKTMISKVRKSGPSEVELFDVLFPESVCRDLFLELDESIKIAKRLIHDEDADTSDVVAAIWAAAEARSSIRYRLRHSMEEVAK